MIDYVFISQWQLFKAYSDEHINNLYTIKVLKCGSAEMKERKCGLQPKINEIMLVRGSSPVDSPRKLL